MKKIFLLDDNEELLEITQMVLGKEYLIHCKLDTDSISDELRSFKPDLMLIDHFIGESNSGEIIKNIQTAIPGFSVPFILFSASHDIVERAKEMGAVGFIEKPASIAYIKSYVKGFFDNKLQANTNP